MQYNIDLNQYAYVYILSNKHKTTIYIGVTTHLSKRISDHKNGQGSIFSSKYKLTQLIYLEGYDRIEDAIHREKQLKGWKRAWKERLINEFNPEWKDLGFDVLQF